MDSSGLLNNFDLVNDSINNCYAEYNGKNLHYIEVKVNNKFSILNDYVKISSKIINSDVFSINKDKIGYFNYKQYTLIVEADKNNSKLFDKLKMKKIRLIYPMDNYNVEDILELINELYNMEIIKYR